MITRHQFSRSQSRMPRHCLHKTATDGTATTAIANTMAITENWRRPELTSHQAIQATSNKPSTRANNKPRSGSGRINHQVKGKVIRQINSMIRSHVSQGTLFAQPSRLNNADQVPPDRWASRSGEDNINGVSTDCRDLAAESTRSWICTSSNRSTFLKIKTCGWS